jgi:hypothetical protein
VKGKKTLTVRLDREKLKLKVHNGKRLHRTKLEKLERKIIDEL